MQTIFFTKPTYMKRKLSLVKRSKVTGITKFAIKQTLEIPITYNFSGVSEAQTAYKKARNKQEKEEIAQCWNELSLRETYAANTTQGAMRIYYNSPQNSESEIKSLQKWVELTANNEKEKKSTRQLQKWNILLQRSISSIESIKKRK